MKSRIGIMCLASGLLTMWGSTAFSAYTNVVNGSTNILAGSFLITNDLKDMPWINPAQTNKATNAVAWVGLDTRTNWGQAQTRGAVVGQVSFLCGHPIGANGYPGIDINVWSGNVIWNDMVRYPNATHGGLIFWDFDLSDYLAGKEVGTIPGQSQFMVKMDYGNRRTSSGLGVPMFISYNDGAGLTLDTTVTTNETPAVGLTYSIITNTDHFVEFGAIPPGPPAAGIVSFDITDHILASTDQVFRIAAFVQEYYGDLNILNDSGIQEVIVDLETAPPYIPAVSVSGSDLSVTWYSTTNRTYDLEMATDLAAGEWAPIPGYTNIPGEELTTTATGLADGGAEYIRVTAQPPTSLLPLEDFESGAPGWIPDDGAVWELGTPTFGATNANSGVNAYGTNLDGPYPRNANAALLSPVIDLTAASKATLSYWEWMQMDSFGSDLVQVFVRDASGNALGAPLDQPFVGPILGTGSVVPWAERIASLPPEAMGQEITLEFNFQSDSLDEFSGWFIDDVMVVEQ